MKEGTCRQLSSRSALLRIFLTSHSVPPPPPCMPLIAPIKTLGGLAWWSTVRSDPVLLAQVHYHPHPFYLLPVFRFLLYWQLWCFIGVSNSFPSMFLLPRLTDLPPSSNTRLRAFGGANPTAFCSPRANIASQLRPRKKSCWRIFRWSRYDTC